jgi:hypothetical protein
LSETITGINPKTTEFAKVIETGYIDPKILKLSPNNNRTFPITEKEKAEMKSSIDNIGVVEPIIINKNNEIVSGGLRWAGALASGVDKIPFIRMDFPSDYEERIVSLLQDYFKHMITARDRKRFVENQLKTLFSGTKEEFKKSKWWSPHGDKRITRIANDLGVNEQTIRRWLEWEEIPCELETKPKLIETFLEQNAKKQSVLRSILKTPQFKNDEKKQEELMEFSEEATLGEVQDVRKDAGDGVPVKISERLERTMQRAVLLEFKIPATLDHEFSKILTQLNLDRTTVLVELIENYIKHPDEVLNFNPVLVDRNLSFEPYGIRSTEKKNIRLENEQATSNE